MSKHRVLLVEDSPTLSLVYTEYLNAEPVDVIHVDSGCNAMAEIKQGVPDVILLDLNLPDMDGMGILKHVHEQALPCAVVIITAHGSVDIAVDAMRYGAFDFITKPFDAKRLLVTLRNALKHRELNDIVDVYREQYEREEYFGFIGASLAMQGVYRIIESAAPSNATVFITGESGTGKEVCAEAVHKQSPRKDNAIVAINCAAIPHDLMESEIFGHTKGAFTGAVAERPGAATQADGGTLFLDEICEMDMELQSKLLRFIQTGTFKKVGGSKLEKVDVRFVCATNRDPLKEVEEGRFREDLYYRLHVIPIQLPPFRERGEDVLLIARRFLNQYSEEEGKQFESFAPETETILMNYEWPGNIRQMQNVIRNLVVLNNSQVVVPELLPPPLNNPALLSGSAGEVSRVATTAPQLVSHPNGIVPLWLVEKQTIEQAIELCGGNIPKAAAMLEVSPSTVYRKKQAWETAGQV
ncbi:sigma-54-dependent transcriptional regulator [Pseudomonadota bacterium]